MEARRASGILMHVTSLPSRFGTGDLGPEAYRWIDFLADAGQRCWQVLPLGPTTRRGGNSPYVAASAFAGNPLLVSPELLVEDGWLRAADVEAAALPVHDRADYDGAARTRHALLDQAYAHFCSLHADAGFDAFCAAHADWLHPFAEFRARGHAATAEETDTVVRREKFVQFLFDRQWTRLRAYARKRGVYLFGDVPFYVGVDSADVWNHPELFKLDDAGRPVVVAGVPPDAFSLTGQLWGNPVYDWDAHARDRFAWWVARMGRAFDLFDVVRLDHFRGVTAHWEVPAGSVTARDGRWVPGPGAALLGAIAEALPGRELVAEDLGVITADVRELMRTFALPGMRVLLFAFDPDTGGNLHAPHMHVPDAVVYTGTHDNNTARGWFEEDADVDARARVERYFGREMSASAFPAALVRAAMMSVCRICIIPLQDVLELGGRARMNRPAAASGNWEWRVTPGQLSTRHAEKLAELVESYGRT